MTTAAVTQASEPELGLLMTTEAELDAMLARARLDAAAMIAGARAEAQEQRARQEAELQELLARRGGELASQRADQEQRIALEAQQTAKRYDGIGDEMVAQLARQVIDELDRESEP